MAGLSLLACSTYVMIILALSPVFFYSSQYVNNVGIPIVLMGVLSVCAGVLSLRLPETKGKPTPETLEELRKDADLVMDDL